MLSSGLTGLSSVATSIEGGERSTTSSTTLKGGGIYSTASIAGGC